MSFVSTAWLQQIHSATVGLHVSLLVRHPETKELFVNFDPQLITLIRETECMHKMGLEIPYNAQSLKHMEPTLKKNCYALEVSGINSLL